MVSQNLYIPIVLTLSLVYTLTFGFCMYKTNKFNYFNDEWRHTKIFYISVIVQTFLRMTTSTLLTFGIPEQDRYISYITLMRSIPDSLFFINYLLLAYQTLSIFYHSHMENNIQVSLLMHFSRPKFRKARKIIGLLMIGWLGFMGLIYTLLISGDLQNAHIDAEFTAVNLISATFVLIFLMYLNSKYSETPFKSQQDRYNSEIVSSILLIWTIGRYFKGFLGLLNLKSASFLSYLSSSDTSDIGGALMFVTQSLVCEVLCFYVVMDYRFINIFITQDRANMSKSDNYAEFLTGNSIQEVQIDTGPYIEPHCITNIAFYKKRPQGLGELYTGLYQNKKIIYRKINFSRISGYIIEDIKLEIQELKKISTPGMITFYGAMMNLPEIGLVFAEIPKSLYRIFHEDQIIMSLKDKTGLIKRIIRVVQNLHHQGMAHGHLSSHNILIKKDNRPIISDFGLEKLKKYAGLTINYTNKNIWTSPELLKDTSLTVLKANFSDDVYSIGVIIWEIITGDIPYSDIEIQDLKNEICINGIRPRLPEYFPKDLIKILKSCWAPAETRASMQDVYNKVTNMKLTN
ncbi:hypothetical protein SteCoe_22793 [Stentor coeruleus]|uniref:Protein kinase domain-containing protein n=1 Tax=Stentor coeruleus TaxID=5963 RepID=A0A1R2BM08_9CILI|nr:hypothetical protein SteCoe_22793 [Stentor coeruleus]